MTLMRKATGWSAGTLTVLAAACSTTGPSAPTAVAGPTGTPPVLEAVTFHEVIERYRVVYPEFRFHAEDGNVVAVHRELLSSTRPGGARVNAIGHINISADQQRRGAVYVGGWPCGPETYTATLRAFLVDANGNRSNALDYTVQCRGL